MQLGGGRADARRRAAGRRLSAFKLLASGACLCFGVAGLSACGSLTPEQNLGVGFVAATALGAQAPSHEVQQTYYLGVFDPREQVEPTVYRVRLHGQASFLSLVNFASGWLPAAAIDSLGTTIEFDKETRTFKPTPASAREDGFQTGRRLVLFGPEGFREAPAGHRLVVAMGSSPETFFNAVNEAMATAASATQGGPVAAELDAELLAALEAVSKERRQLDAILLQRSTGSAP